MNILFYIISTICSLIFFYLLFFCVKKQERGCNGYYYDMDIRNKRTIGRLIIWFILSTLPGVNFIVLIISILHYCAGLGSEKRWIIDHPIFDKIVEFLNKEV